MAANKVKITQLRSSIKKPQVQKATLVALGLGKINRSVEVDYSPSIQGMVRVVSHLVKVEEV